MGGNSAMLDLAQLQQGLAMASLMYVLASVLVMLSGFLHLGRLFKMIPNPVTAGISNSTALLLLMLAVNKAADGGLPAWGVAVAMVAAFMAWGWFQHRSMGWTPWVPAIVVALLLGFAGSSVWVAHTSVAWTAPAVGIQDGAQWVSFGLWQLLNTERLGAWWMLALPGAITLALVMVLESFAAASVMELRFGARSHADRELVAQGCANLVGAVLGSLPATASPIYSSAAWLAGGRGRATSWVCYGFSALLLIFFFPLLMGLPAGIAAGLLCLQAMLMVNPVFVASLSLLFRSWRGAKDVAQDMGFWITVLISLVGYVGNLIWASFAGVSLSCLVVLRRVSVNLTADWMYLDALRSRRIRAAAESDALFQLAHHAGVLRLTGHLFFGNSARITQLADELDESCLCAVIDVSQVQDVDPSGLDALTWLVRTLQDRPMRVVLAGLDKSRVPTLQAALRALHGPEHCVDLDRGLEYAEEWILQNATKLPRTQQARPIEANSLLHGLTEDEITAVLLVVDERQVAQGEALFRRDARSDGVWMLQSGQVSILAGGGPLAARLATFGPGQFVGEMGFIDGHTRSATVTADTPVQAVLLDRHAVTALVREHPEAALKITRNIARELAQRVRTTSAVLTSASSGPESTWENSALSVINRSTAR
jgi:SulP family sulfate permease